MSGRMLPAVCHPDLQSLDAHSDSSTSFHGLLPTLWLQELILNSAAGHQAAAAGTTLLFKSIKLRSTAVSEL